MELGRKVGRQDFFGKETSKGGLKPSEPCASYAPVYNADVTYTIYSINYVFNCMFVGLMWIWLVSNDNYR